jgi:hypothetical protein
MILKPHPVYGLPHAIATTDYDGSSEFERCMSSMTVAIGQIERLDPASLDRDQRARLNAAVMRLASALKDTEQ